MPSRRIPLYVHIAYLFVGLLLTFAIVSNGYQFLQNREQMVNGAKKHFELVRQLALSELDALYRPTVSTVSLLAHQRLMRAQTVEARLDSLQFLVAALDSQPALTSLYMGYDTGDFFMIRPWRDEAALIPLFNPPAGTRWIVQSIQVIDGQTVGEHLFIGADFQVIERRARPDYRYDPRSRPWFVSAKERGGLYVTDPYLFFSTGQPGVSFAHPTENGSGVAGADITLNSLNALLLALKATPDSRIALLNAKDEVLSWQKGAPQMMDAGAGKLRLPHLDELQAPILQRLVNTLNQAAEDSLSFQTAGDDWQASALPCPPLAGKP
ncbi:hypothetical protein G3O07_18345 [Pseudomonas laurentiana]|uniref:Cache domain-containing protein n=1 Tax=Pseudomonas laurentiana TaxID=2364649 RepID=A0A6I5RTI4_9PSED|nr:hypothetical protein [Pseudomonas laurentiana]